MSKRKSSERVRRARHVLKDNKGKCTLDQYIEDTGIVFGTWDTQRSTIDVWMRLVRHASKLAEVVRRKQSDLIVEELGGVFIWMLSFIRKLRDPANTEDRVFYLPEGRRMTDILWEKYPATCPACFDRMVKSKFPELIDTTSDELTIENIWHRVEEWPEDEDFMKDWMFKMPCNCVSDPIVEERNENADPAIRLRKDQTRMRYARALRSNLERKNALIETMDDLEDMFRAIYGPKLRNAETVESIAFHLLEEIGEISKALMELRTFNYQADQISRDAPLQRDRRIKELRSLRAENLEEEIADVFSWMFSLTLKMQENFSIYGKYVQKTTGVKLPVTERITLPDIVFSLWGGPSGLYCRKCKRAECEGDKECSWLFIKSISKEGKIRLC